LQIDGWGRKPGGGEVGALQQAYFDLVYNPLYDATTAKLSRYKALQQKCLRALDLEKACRLLCVGLGTGNELVAALRAAAQIEVSGIDLSPSALASSRRKLRLMGRTADLQIMDAAVIGHPDGSFDRVLCMHVLDFVDDPGRAVREIVRVLGPGGRFVMTLPSRLEGTGLGLSLARDEVRTALRSGRHPLSVVADLLFKLVMGLVYVPLLARSGHHVFSAQQVRALFERLPVGTLAIEEELAYQDFIVTGEKL
jgi:ubiquinone/menaquinone biosynthesis C-methylase UbiE